MIMLLLQCRLAEIGGKIAGEKEQLVSDLQTTLEELRGTNQLSRLSDKVSGHFQQRRALADARRLASETAEQLAELEQCRQEQLASQAAELEVQVLCHSFASVRYTSTLFILTAPSFADRVSERVTPSAARGVCGAQPHRGRHHRRTRQRRTARPPGADRAKATRLVSVGQLCIAAREDMPVYIHC